MRAGALHKWRIGAGLCCGLGRAGARLVSHSSRRNAPSGAPGSLAGDPATSTLKQGRRRAGVACDERTTVAVGRSCSTHRMVLPAFADTVLLESGGINVTNVPLSSP